jgi:hypothetical protein
MLVGLVGAGCSTLYPFEQPANISGAAGTIKSKRVCESDYATPYVAWGAAAAATAFLSGASGVSTLAFDANPDGSRSTGQTVAPVVSLGVGVASVVSTFLAGYYAKQYADDCSGGE